MADGGPAFPSSDGRNDASTEIETGPLDVLANELRIRILRTLADDDGPLTFTELREAVDVRDTGRFNYHLNELCEYFVRETPDGYELGHAGSRIVAAGRDAVAGEDMPAEMDDRCPVCGETGCEKLYHVHLRPPASHR